MPTTNKTHQLMSNRQKGVVFENAALAHLTDVEKLTRIEDDGINPTEWAERVGLALRPTGDAGIFEHQTVAEGFWIDRYGNPVWVECSGVWTSTGRPGFQRSDTTRKIAGTVACLVTLCAEAQVAPPSVLLITSHVPKRASAAAAYLTWGVIRNVGRQRCRIVVLDASGKAREVSSDTYCKPAA